MTAVRHDLPVDVSRETLEKLRAYAELLARWTRKINLVAPGTVDTIWTRHVVDSAQVFPEVASASKIADLGSGGGLPGVVLAIIASELAPGMDVVLVESDQRKATFLRTCIRQMGLQATVEARRIEDVPALGAAAVTARALAPLDRLLPLVERHLEPSGRAILLKGRTASEEIEIARHGWDFDLTQRPSITDPTASCLILENIRRV